MITTHYYRVTCGSLYRVTSRASTRQQPASVMQAHRSVHATTFSPGYSATASEMARLVSLGSFTEVPAP